MRCQAKKGRFGAFLGIYGVACDRQMHLAHRMVITSSADSDAIVAITVVPQNSCSRRHPGSTGQYLIPWDHFDGGRFGAIPNALENQTIGAEQRRQSGRRLLGRKLRHDFPIGAVE